MELKEKYNYFRTLGDSFRIAFKNPKIFVPYIISFLIGMLFLPFAAEIQNPEFILGNMWLFIIYALFNMAIGLIIYGWTFSLISQIVNRNKAELGSSFKRSLSFGLRFLGISVLVFIFMLVFYLVIILLIMLIAIISEMTRFAMIGAAIGGVIGAVFLAFTILFFTAALQLIPVLIVEDKGVIDTIIKTYRFYMNKKIYSLNIFLISLVLGIILSSPGLIYQFIVLTNGILTTAPVTYTTSQMAVIALLYLLPTLLMIVLYIYYSKSYQIKKATIKRK